MRIKIKTRQTRREEEEREETEKREKGGDGGERGATPFIHPSLYHCYHDDLIAKPSVIYLI